ncbi:MAG: hypothetical protein ABR571_17610 [Jatrophihabitans sp.]|uniref:hypothetical protein n=1 Tax=Jatrophihabitans sp. TaxID=1932789 RepID=UPI0039103BF3
MAGIEIHWSGLVKVAEVSLAFGVGIVAVFALGVLGLSKAEAAKSAPAGSTARATGLAGAGLAFLVCGAALLYGLYLLIPQFH